MAWMITVDGNDPVDSDDFLLDDLAYVEKHGESPWSVANPFASIKVAKAFLRVALVRSGTSPEDADNRLQALTLGDVKAAFDFRPDTPADDDTAGGQLGNARKKRATSSRSSSAGARPSTTGPRPLSGNSA